MKRVLSAILASTLIVSSLCIGTWAAPAYVPGDAKADGRINASDALSIRKYIVDNSYNIDVDAADANSDGRINAVDALIIRKHLAGDINISEDYPVAFEKVGRIRINGVNIKNYEIIVSDRANENMKFAASELQKYIKMACGKELPIKSTPTSDYKILIIADEVGTLGNDGFSISVTKGTLTILGAAKRGTMYGVYELLEKYMGYRFYGYYDVDLTDVANIDLPDGLVDTQIPKTTYRCITIDPYEDQYTYHSTIKRKLSGSTDNPSMLTAKYGYGIERVRCNAHSLDYFVPWGISACLNDEEVFEVCTENMSKLIDERLASGQKIGNELTEISCSYAAGTKFCPCYLCKDVYKEEGSYAGVLVDFVNAVDDYINEKYPGLTVMTNAYSEVRIPPKTRTLNDDVILLYCWNGCANHEIGSGECTEQGNSLGFGNYTEEQYYLGWTEHASQLYVWYYPTNIYYMLSPLSSFFNLYNDFRWFMEHKAIGFYVVGTAADSFEGLMAYLISKLMWNCDITYEEYISYIKEYLKYYFGDGYENIYTYMEMLRESGDLQPCFMNDYDYPLTMYSSDYMGAHFDDFKELFAAAMAAANDEQRVRLERLSAHMYFLCYAATYETNYVNGTDIERSEYEEGYRAWYDYVKENKIRVTYGKTGISTYFTMDKSPSKLVYGLDQ